MEQGHTEVSFLSLPFFASPTVWFPFPCHWAQERHTQWSSITAKSLSWVWQWLTWDHHAKCKPRAFFLVFFASYLVTVSLLWSASHFVLWDPSQWTRWNHQQNVSCHNLLKSHIISDFSEWHTPELIAYKGYSLPTSVWLFLTPVLRNLIGFQKYVTYTNQTIIIRGHINSFKEFFGKGFWLLL